MSVSVVRACRCCDGCPDEETLVTWSRESCSNEVEMVKIDECGATWIKSGPVSWQVIPAANGLASVALLVGDTVVAKGQESSLAKADASWLSALFGVGEYAEDGK